LDSYLDTYHMGAREYDPSLGRWLSADTIVPEPENPQSLNRYAYVYNNPLKYVDPSGHIAENEVEDAEGILEELQRDYGVFIEKDWRYIEFEGRLVWTGGVWSLGELQTILQGVQDLATEISGELNGSSPEESFRNIIGPVSMRKGNKDDYWYKYWVSQGRNPLGLAGLDGVISFYHGFSERNVVHELGHVWASREGWQGTGLTSYIWHHGCSPPPTKYAQTDPGEHWAETVEVWVYGVPSWERGRTFSTSHEEYVSLAVTEPGIASAWASPVVARDTAICNR
jgi:RHS repeat-associated protein